MSRSAKIGLVVAALFLGGGAVHALRRPAEGAAEERPRLRTVAVAEAPVRVVVAATGVVEPSFKVEVKSKASGEVVSFPLEPGDAIAAGAPLAELDPTDEARNVRLRESELSSNRASLAAAEADLGLAEARASRAEELAKGRMLSPEELDSARFALARAKAAAELARSAIARSEIALEEARDRLSDTKIAAPISGILLTKAVEKGHIIASGITSFSGGTALATIADMSRVFVLADVDEADVGKVKVGAAARITADAFRDTPFEGRVERIMPLGVEEQNVTVFRAKIEVVSEEKKLLLPNMTVDVQIHVAAKESAVVVPNTALRARGDRTGVEVLGPGGTAAFREVRRGLTDGIVTEVEGVRPGEEVVLGEERRGEAASGTGFRFFGLGGSRPRTTGTSTGGTTK